MKHVIRLGDPTSHGGTVTSAADDFSIMGKGVARVGDSCSCPRRGHHNCTIAEGDPNWSIGGRAVALDGCKATCGAVLISTLGNLVRSHEGEGSAGSGGYGPAAWPPSLEDENEGRPDEQVRVVDAKSSEPIPDLAYYIQAPNGSTYIGKTDAAGLCKRVATFQPEELTVWLGEEAEQKIRAHDDR